MCMEGTLRNPAQKFDVLLSVPDANIDFPPEKVLTVCQNQGFGGRVICHPAIKINVTKDVSGNSSRRCFFLIRHWSWCFNLIEHLFLLCCWIVLWHSPPQLLWLILLGLVQFRICRLDILDPAWNTGKSCIPGIVLT